MLRLFDKNKSFARFLNIFSKTLAYQRGLLMIIGVALTVVSWLVMGIVLIAIVSDAEVEDIWYLLCLPGSLLHLAVLVGFIGVMMVIPLGQGYKE
ncbi:MAG: hypothetical protein K8I82_00895 [Anaerolineae bacterium]|jgi:hypothetical protein|nr:hypothetical protein [Anaerolineae bacterium]